MKTKPTVQIIFIKRDPLKGVNAEKWVARTPIENLVYLPSVNDIIETTNDDGEKGCFEIVDKKISLDSHGYGFHTIRFIYKTILGKDEDLINSIVIK